MTDAIVAATDSVHAEDGQIQAVTSLVYLRGGQLVTDSLQIARAFGRRHDNVLQSLDNLILGGSFNHLDFKVVKRLDQKGESRRVIALTERMALIAAPFIGGRRALELQIVLVDAFMKMREMLRLDARDWNEARRTAAVSSTIMNDAIKEMREKLGKSTDARHYMTEAKLVNSVVFGRHTGIDREGLSPADLRKIERTQLHNATLIASGKSYEERKEILPKFVHSLDPTGVKTRDNLDSRLVASGMAGEKV